MYCVMLQVRKHPSLSGDNFMCVCDNVLFSIFYKKIKLAKKNSNDHTLKSRGVTGSLAKNQKKRTPRECFFGFESFRECFFFFFYGEFSRLIATKFAINPRE